MLRVCDLHTHSTFSDGSHTPSEIIQEAERIGLSAVALCDHNSVVGISEFLKAAESTAVEAVPGIEISVDYMGTELHVLALYIPVVALSAYAEYVEQARKNKEISNRELVTSLNKAGYPLDYNAILKKSSGGGFNRVHVATELVALGCVSTIDEAFETLLSPKAGYYRPPVRLDVFETITFIRSTGAVAVLAHPLLNLNATELCVFLKKAITHGLVGMEVLYSKYNAEEAELSAAIAAEFGLLPSGGSDFHGDNKQGLHLGIGYGSLAIPYAFAEQLKRSVEIEVFQDAVVDAAGK